MEQRKAYLDYIKTIAIILVVIYHSYIVQNPLGNALLSCCVPLFFVVNGYLMLNKERDERIVLRKAVKFFIIFWIWGIFSTAIQQFVTSEPITILSVVKHIYNSDPGYITHLWFLQTMIIIYLLFPFIQSYLKNSNSRYKLFYILILSGLCSIQFLCVFMRKINPVVGWHGYALFYFVLGYAILKEWNNYLIKIKVYWFFIAFLISIVFQTMLNMYLPLLNTELRRSLYADELVFGGYRSIFVVFMVVSIVLFLSKVKLSSNYIITYIGKNTLGIYLTQDIVYKFIRFYYPQITKWNLLFPLLVIIICCLLCLLLNTNKLGQYIIHI